MASEVLTQDVPAAEPEEDADGPYRWSVEEFIAAWEADVFERRVELIEGEVWPVVIGDWHGHATMRLPRRLPNDRFECTQSSVTAPRSLFDPDCWVHAAGVKPVRWLSRRMSAYAVDDVLLVIEVGDETKQLDLGRKAALYAAGGYGVYWVVTREGIYEHTGPSADGYAHRHRYGPDDQIPVGYAATTMPVRDLLPPPEPPEPAGEAADAT